LLDGRKVTTHWRWAEGVARRFPKLRLVPDALFLKDGPFYTSAGVTAGIDLSLALIEEDLGPRAALAVARELVVFLKRPGGQEQFSEPLQFQFQTGDRFRELVTWILTHLDANLSVERLAERTHLCPRHFSRLFSQVLRRTPGAFVREARLREARLRLAKPAVTVSTVAAAVGFHNADVFRRAFLQRFRITPGSYQARFAIQEAVPRP
jgi:transcriptional regulator GlxA family with amidase domain